MNTEKNIKAGIVQFDVKLGDIEANKEHVFNRIAKLGEEGAALALLPELWSFGFDNRNIADHAGRTPSILEDIAGLASKYNMIIAGSLPEASGRDIYNTLYVIDKNGEIAGQYRKIHLFSLTGEDTYYSAGSKAVVCETSIGQMGLMICYDLRFPELCRSLVLEGAKVIIVSAQWPTARISHWETLVRARAIENQAFVLAANRCGQDPGLDYGGSSRIISPEGNIITAAEDNACIVTGELDFNELDDFRNRIPCLNERVPKSYFSQT